MAVIPMNPDQANLINNVDGTTSNFQIHRTGWYMVDMNTFDPATDRLQILVKGKDYTYGYLIYPPYNATTWAYDPVADDSDSGGGILNTGIFGRFKASTSEPHIVHYMHMEDGDVLQIFAALAAQVSYVGKFRPVTEWHLNAAPPA